MLIDESAKEGQMFDLGTPVWQIAVRAAVVYVAVFGGIRLLGKREIGQMTPFDLVVMLLLANAVQNAMVGPDASLQGGLVAAAVLLSLNAVVGLLRIKSPFLGRLFEGHPTVLVEHGTLVLGAMRRQGLDEDDVMMAAREHGLDHLSDVDLAVLETDGSISVVPMSTPALRTPRRRARTLRKHG
jgi:uncharacterized membrane protein YcaP (DUF421 family)